MTSVLGLFSLTLFYWSLTSLAFKLPAFLRLAVPPILSVSSFQLLVYYSLGYWDPFVIIASVVSFFGSVMITIFLEFGRAVFKKLKFDRTISSISMFVVCLLASVGLMVPMLVEVREEVQFRALVDQTLLAKVREFAKSIVVEELELNQEFSLEINYVKNEYYLVNVFVGDEHFAIIKIDAISLKKRSVELLKTASKS